MSKIILITGASSGIGFSTAEQLISEGHIVYVAARSVEKMKSLEEKGAIVIKLDITKEEDIIACVKKVIDDQRRIDVLFNNAGYGLFGSVEDIPIADAKHQFEVNLFGLARMTQEVVPHMRKQQSGKIINTSSMGGKIYTLFGAWYHATKHALEGWSDCLRLELKPFNIDVVVIEPGIIATEFSNVVHQNFKQKSTTAYKTQIDQLMNVMNRSNLKFSHPIVIAKEVSKAIKDKTPKTRYVAGSMAKTLMRIRQWLGDRMYDRVILSMLK